MRGREAVLRAAPAHEARAVSSALSSAQACCSEMVSLLRELVEIESPSQHADGVRAVALRMARELQIKKVPLNQNLQAVVMR